MPIRDTTMDHQMHKAFLRLGLHLRIYMVRCKPVFDVQGTYHKEGLDKNLEDEVEVVDDAEVLPIKNPKAH